jgi:methylated-DNA-[protein]-cysteine S-methyltransferase
MNTLYYNFYEVVKLKLNFDEHYLLCSVDFWNDTTDFTSEILHSNQRYFIDILDNYFNQSEYEIDFNLLNLNGLSKFYVDIYKTLVKTPVGKTTTYRKLSEDAGYKNAYRATGSCMKRNRWPIFIPCHRVLSANSIGGFSSGINLKVKLLELEKRFAF